MHALGALLGRAVVVAVVLWSASGMARANDLREEARAHGELGKIAFRHERWDEALAEFKKAYALAPVPDLLFNIARCQEQLHQDDDAVRSYEQYLAAKPDAPDRAEVESQVKALKERAAARPTPPTPPPATTPVTPPPATTPATPPTATPTATAATLTAPAPHEDATAARRKKLALGLGIGGALLVVGAVTVGLVVGLSGTAPYQGNLSPGFGSINP